MEIENIDKLSTEEIVKRIENNSPELKPKRKKYQIKVSGQMGLKATILVDDESIEVKEKVPLPILVVIAIGAIAGVWFYDIYIGFAIAFAIGFATYFVFYKKKMQKFIRKIGNSLI